MPTSRERVRTSLSWQEPDRVPIQTYLTPEVRAKLETHFAGRNVLECLGVDFRTVNPPYRGKVRPRQDGIRYDLWGTGYRRVELCSAGA